MSNTPALLMRQCTGSPLATIASANARTEPSASRSSFITSQSIAGPGVALLAASRVQPRTSASPRSTVRHARMTFAPSFASVSAVVVPMPLVGPVTMNVFPATSGPHTSAGSVGKRRVCHR